MGLENIVRTVEYHNRKLVVRRADNGYEVDCYTDGFRLCIVKFKSMDEVDHFVGGFIYE